MNIRLVCWAFALLPLLGLAADEVPVSHVIRAKKTQRVLLMSPMAVNRRWVDLPAADAAYFRRFYKIVPNVSHVDEPPFPADGLESLLTSIARAADQRRHKGMVQLAATVDTEGRAVDVRVTGTDDEEMRSLISDALLTERYKPAVCGGEPCQLDFRLTMQLRGN